MTCASTVKFLLSGCLTLFKYPGKCFSIFGAVHSLDVRLDYVCDGGVTEPHITAYSLYVHLAACAAASVTRASSHGALLTLQRFLSLYVPATFYVLAPAHRTLLGDPSCLTGRPRVPCAFAVCSFTFILVCNAPGRPLLSPSSEHPACPAPAHVAALLLGVGHGLVGQSPVDECELILHYYHHHDPAPVLCGGGTRCGCCILASGQR